MIELLYDTIGGAAKATAKENSEVLYVEINKLKNGRLIMF